MNGEFEGIGLRDPGGMWYNWFGLVRSRADASRQAERGSARCGAAVTFAWILGPRSAARDRRKSEVLGVNHADAT